MDRILEWLLEGDVSVQYLTRKYLLRQPQSGLTELRQRIAAEGFGRRFLQVRQPNGHWGYEFYSPKWISSHYTLLDLRYLEIELVEEIGETLRLILRDHKGPDGSLYESRMPRRGDVCVNGMFLNYAAFFGVPEDSLRSVVDFLMSCVMPDGGFNCDFLKPGVHHSSMHTTLSVLEGLWEFRKQGYAYRSEELTECMAGAEEFLLIHHLFRSDKTGEIINPAWLRLSFPVRWKYDILRALVYFADRGILADPRLVDAVKVLRQKQRKDGTWPVQAKHSGLVHFDMEKTGEPSRFNTLRALRVLNSLPEGGNQSGMSLN